MRNIGFTSEDRPTNNTPTDQRTEHTDDHPHPLGIQQATRFIDDAHHELHTLLASGELSSESSQPLHIVIDSLSNVSGTIDRARTAIGNPTEAIPIFRLPTTNHRLSNASPNSREPSDQFNNPSLPNPHDNSRPTPPLRPEPDIGDGYVRSVEGLIQQAITHLERAGEVLGAQSDIPVTTADRPSLLRCNEDLGQAKQYVESAKANLLTRRPNENPNPPPPPIIGGDDDLFPFPFTPPFFF